MWTTHSFCLSRIAKLGCPLIVKLPLELLYWVADFLLGTRATPKKVLYRGSWAVHCIDVAYVREDEFSVDMEGWTDVANLFVDVAFGVLSSRLWLICTYTQFHAFCSFALAIETV